MNHTVKGLLVLVKNGRIKAVYCHRNAQMDKFGKQVMKLCRTHSPAQLSDLYDRLVEVEEEAEMTPQQRELFRPYLPEPCWKEDLTWTDVLCYTRQPLAPLIDGVPYIVNYAGFIPSWRNRWRYTIDLDQGYVQVAKGGLELLCAESEEFSKSVVYPKKIAAAVIGRFALTDIPDDWLDQCRAGWDSLQLKFVPRDDNELISTQSMSDPDGQHTAWKMAYFLGMK